MNTNNTGGWSLVLKMCIHVLVAAAVILSASFMHQKYENAETKNIEPVSTDTPSPSPETALTPEPAESESTVPNDRLQRILDRGCINAVVCTEYPGFFMQDVKGDGRQGIDMAVFIEFAKELGVDYRIVNFYDTHQETLHALLENDDVDIAFGGLKGDPDYMDSTLQTDSGVYLADPLVLITQKTDNVTSIDEIMAGGKNIMLTFPENEVDNFASFLNSINFENYLSSQGYSDPYTYEREKAFTNLMFYVSLQEKWHFGLVDRLSAVIHYDTEMWSWDDVDIHITDTSYVTYFYAKQDSRELIYRCNDFLASKTDADYNAINEKYGNQKVYFENRWLYSTEPELLR